jgi:glucose-6-phosphate isomerase
MAKRESIELDVKPVMGKPLNKRHQISAAKLKALTPKLKSLITMIEKERAAGDHRYRDLPHQRKMLRQVQAAAKRYRPKTDNLVVLGIGGSALGNVALQQALNPATYNLLPRSKRKGPRLFVLDNVDPAYVGAVLDFVGGDLKRTLFNVISKSGETAETAAQFLIIRDLLRKKLGPAAAKRQILVTTDPARGTMRGIVDAEGFESLEVPDGVGGRFSVFSAVGLFSAAMCNIDVAGMLQGAAAMDQRVQSTAVRQNPAAMLAAIHYLYYKAGKPLHVMMPYSNQLYGLADWFRQLWAESLGKRLSADGKREVFEGPTPIKALGTTDQHSQVQLYREGPNDKIVTFLEIADYGRDLTIPKQLAHVDAMAYLGNQRLSKLINAEKVATEKAMLASDRPCLTVRFPRISASTVGQFIYLYEAATTITGRLLNIDPYDQPGVELGKKITFHLMGRKGYRTMPKD